MREFLAKNKFLWQNVGNISLEAQVAWVNLTCGDDLYFRECLFKSANALKAELTGKNPDPIEKLLAERVVMSWLQLGYLEAREAQQGEKELRWAEYRRRRQDQAYRQFMRAADALATLRRLVPQTVYLPVVQQAPASLPDARPGQETLPAHMNGHGHKANGHSHLNGHNSRFGHLLAVGANGDG